MSVRKRSWVTRKGEKKTAWVFDYVDQSNARHVATFARKKDADNYRATVKVDVRTGVHTAPTKSITVVQAAEDWIAGVELEGRERATVAQYRQHANRHIRPRLGRERQHPVSTHFAMIFCCT
jgi:integrase